MRAVYYARVSTDSDDQVNSLHNQISFFADFITENNYSKVDCGILARKNNVFEYLEGGYADEGISGKSLKKREAFKQMIKDAKQRKFDIIITKSVARFGRSVEDTSKTVKDLKELGIGVYFLDLKVNSLDNSKEFMINLFASLAQEESNNKSYIVQFGIRKAQQMGKFTGHAPFGYDVIDGYLQINESEKVIVKRIYDLYYNQAFGHGKIARLFNKENIKTKKGAQWSQIQISRILDNPVYKGLQIQHMTQTTDINRDIRKVIPEEEWIKHNKPELLIIEKDFFDMVQIEKQRRLEEFGHISYIKDKYIDEEGNIKIVQKRRIARGEKRHSSAHIFSNLLFCQNCGSGMKRKKRKAYVRNDGTSKDLGYEWSCTSNDMYGKEKCAYRNAYIELDLINFARDEIVNYRNSSIISDTNINLYIQRNMDAKNDEVSIEDIEAEIEKINAKVELNFELLSEGTINKDEYKKRNEKQQSALKILESNLNKLKYVETEVDEIRLRYNNFKKTLENFNQEEITNGALRRILKRINIFTDINNKKIPSIEWIFMDTTKDALIKDVMLSEKPM
ncbi:hypothetical protein BC351_01350 [Paenibacillus ferrarius]|uniref:Serine recombinase n=1 Tax=Paenibacillus ferrarius TaxID=1469647 RepID=A0A1V4HTL2_9BACL|nr:recombinase family protein [Paenibacillus ferrarius]OPH61915.1 hypothetical protein BC351_01350 [Paenibacillus ferrarius]